MDLLRNRHPLEELIGELTGGLLVNFAETSSSPMGYKLLTNASKTHRNRAFMAYSSVEMS
jgi:hypothetical protein